jgi:hypothetical protein
VETDYVDKDGISMDLERKIDLLLSRGITRTRFESMNLNAAMKGGVPIGDSECKAVVLSVNQCQLYSRSTPQFK